MPGPALNTDRELYREDTGDPAGSYYENSLHVTANGSIGMNVGGTVIVQPIADWHRQALRAHHQSLGVPPLPPGHTRRPAAPALSAHEARVVARFEQADPAPESWDANEAVRRIEAVLATEPDMKPLWEFERGALRGIEMVKTAIRTALRGPS